MAGFGIFLLVQSNSIGLTGSTSVIPIFVTIVGFIVLGIALLGFIGAIKLNRCLLLLLKECLILYFQDAIRNIENATNPSAENVLRKVQDRFGCCGAKGPEDWQKPYQSCCKSKLSSCESYHKSGCAEVIYEWMKKNLLAIGAVVVALALIEIGSIIAASCLIKDLE
nr:tetraspanin [Hymenolepis microstoma]